MKQKNNKNQTFVHFDKILVLIISGLLLLAGLFGLLDKLEFRVYDFLLGKTKAPETRVELLLTEIDNDSLEAIGTWPWSRDIIADDLLRMKEFGAETVVFDVEYLSNSAPVLRNDIEDLVFDLLENPSEEGAISFKTDILKDNDAFFSQALQFFGNSWLTINTLNIGTQISEDDKQFAYDLCLFKNVLDPQNLIPKGNSFSRIEAGGANEDKGFAPALHKFLKSARGAGFTNVIIDSDGTRRRVQLLEKEGDGYIGQLAFAPLLKKIGVQEIERMPGKLILKGAKIDSQENESDISIPVDSHGRMLINWTHDNYFKSYRRVAIARLNELDWAENNIFNGFKNLLNSFYSCDGQPVTEAEEFQASLERVEYFYSFYKDISDLKASLLESCNGFNADGSAVDMGISDMLLEQYFEMRSAFFADLKELIENPAAFEIFTELLSKDDFAELSQNQFEYFGEDVKTIKEYGQKYLENSEELKKQFENSFCIIGNTASSTTDLGITPFERAFPNVGTHANVYNTIMTQNFITPVNWLWGMLAAFVISILLAILTHGKKAAVMNSLGIIGILVVILVPACLMIFGKIYVPLVIPALTVIFSFIAIEIMNFVRSEQDKSFLKHAFATYLNPKSVDEIIKNPEKLSLGGEQKHLTALFSDVQAFSTFSESVTPKKLVEVLQTYLGNMSDCILDVGGTIDKYEGDAIISFFGAPNDLENNAYAACASAIRMKQAEDKYNEENMASGFIPTPLKTRIGINTGEMIVGNMGTDKKFNYTIMGNDVNIAARLEGVNKVYKSWILVSERTWTEANVGHYKDKIVVRPFDRVRVIGIATPIQLYNVVGFRDEMSENHLRAIEIFKGAMEEYLAKNFEKAEEMFIMAAQMVPGDESPLVYAERCKENIKNGVPADWDGIMVMKTK